MAPKKKTSTKSAEKEDTEGVQSEKQPKEPTEKELKLREEYDSWSFYIRFLVIRTLIDSNRPIY